MTTTEQSFCRRGHARPKNGWCRQCGKERYAAIVADPVKREAYQNRKNEEERRRYERDPEYRDRKNGISPEKRAELDQRRKGKKRELKNHAKAVAERLLAKADELARRARVKRA